MTPKEGLIKHLMQMPAVTGLAGTRIFPNKAPQGTFKNFIVVDQVGFDPRYNSTGMDTMQSAQFSVRSYATSEQEADQMADAVRGVAGLSKSTTLGGLNHRGVFLDGVQDISEPPQNADEIGFPAKEVLLTVWFSQ